MCLSFVNETLNDKKMGDPANFVTLGLQAKPNHLSSNKCEALSLGWAKGHDKQGKQAGQTCSLGSSDFTDPKIIRVTSRLLIPGRRLDILFLIPLAKYS